MKKITCVSLLFLFVFCTTTSAQRFSVFAIQGIAYVMSEDGQRELLLGEQLTPESNIIIPSKSSVLLLDLKKKKKMPQLIGPQSGIVKDIIDKKDGVTFIKCLKEVFDYIVGRNASDFGSTNEDGHYIINASSQRSLDNKDSQYLNELDKSVLSIMEQFYQNNKE